MSQTCKRALVAAAILAFSALPVCAKPNFKGDWKLNVSKSDFGQFPPPSAMSQKVVHEDPSLKIAMKMSTDNGDFDFDASYTTDGKECTNEIRGSTMKSVVKWEGDTMVMESKGAFGDNEITIRDKWDLSADGKTLTMRRHFASSRGELDQKLVFEKQ